MIGCDIANYKPASRGAESIGEETLLLEYLLHVSCDGCQTACSPIGIECCLSALIWVALMSLIHVVAGFCLIAFQRVALRRVDMHG